MMNYNSNKKHSNFESSMKKKKSKPKDEWNPYQPSHVIMSSRMVLIQQLNQNKEYISPYSSARSCGRSKMKIRSLLCLVAEKETNTPGRMIGPCRTHYKKDSETQTDTDDFKRKTSFIKQITPRNVREAEIEEMKFDKRAGEYVNNLISEVLEEKYNNKVNKEVNFSINKIITKLEEDERDEAIDIVIPACVDSVLTEVIQIVEEAEAEAELKKLEEIDDLPGRIVKSIAGIDISHYVNAPNDFSPMTPITERDDYRDMQPNDILNDPITRAFLKAYMIKCYQEESIVFWEIVHELKDIANRISKKERKRYCKEIYDTFISDGSKMEININSDMKNRIKESLKRNSDDVSMFDDAETEMAKLIIANNFNDFKKSEFHKKSKAIQQWFEIFPKFDNDLSIAIAESINFSRRTAYIGQYFPPPKDVVLETNKIRKMMESLMSFFEDLFGNCKTDKRNSTIKKKKELISSPIHFTKKSKSTPKTLSPISMDVSTNTKGPMKGKCRTRKYVSNFTQTNPIEFEPIDLSVKTSEQNEKRKSKEEITRKSVASVSEDDYPQITPMHQQKFKDNKNNNNRRRRRRNKRKSGYLLRNAINNRYMKLQKNKDGQFVDENGEVIEGLKEGENGKLLVERIGEDGKVYYEEEGFICDDSDEEYDDGDDYDDEEGDFITDEEKKVSNRSSTEIDFEGEIGLTEEDKKIRREVKKCINLMIDNLEKEVSNIRINSLEARARNSLMNLNFEYLNKLDILSPTDSPMNFSSPFLTPTTNGVESENEKKTRTEKCNKILSDPIFRAFFKAYLTKNFQTESILFWEAIFELEDIDEKVTKAERVKYIKEVYDLFIKEGSKMEININHDIRKKIEDKVNSKTDKVSIYLDAKDEIARLIITNNYENFKKSELYKQAQAIEKWFSIFPKFDPDLKKAIAEQMSLVRQTVFVVPPPKEVVEQDNIIRRLIKELMDFFQRLFHK